MPLSKNGILVKFQFQWQPIQYNKTKAQVYTTVKVYLCRQFLAFPTSFRISVNYDLYGLVPAIKSTNRTALLIVIVRRIGYLVVTIIYYFKVSYLSLDLRRPRRLILQLH